MDYCKISHRTLNLFLFILRGYKTLAKRFSSAPTRGRKEREGEKREREGKEKRKNSTEGKNRRERGRGSGKEVRMTTSAKKRGGKTSKAKGPREHVCFPKDRFLLAPASALSKTHLISSNVRVRPRCLRLPHTSRRASRS